MMRLRLALQLGSSFSNSATGEASYLATSSAPVLSNASRRSAPLGRALEQPDAWSILANLIYWTMLIVIGLAQFALSSSFGLLDLLAPSAQLVGHSSSSSSSSRTLGWIFTGLA